MKTVLSHSLIELHCCKCDLIILAKVNSVFQAIHEHDEIYYAMQPNPHFYVNGIPANKTITLSPRRMSGE